MILLVAHEKDMHTERLAQHLRNGGHAHTHIEIESILRDLRFTSAISNDSALHQLHTDSGDIDLRSVTAVWYRQTTAVRPSSTSSLAPADADFAANETESYLRGLWRVLADRTWVNTPWTVGAASHKLYQLELARALGLVLPTTVVTSDPASAQRFIASCSSGVIAKPLGQGFVPFDDEVEFMFTNPVTVNELDQLSWVRHAPVILQELIDKQYDLRVTLVGEEVFGCAIHSQADDRSRIDWRRHQNVPHEAITLPREVEAQCLQLMQHLGLSFGAIDFAVDRVGRFVFFEINPSGKWLSIEDRTGLPITDSIARLLTTRTQRS